MATMLMPMVATAKVSAPTINTNVFGILATISTGSVMALPNTVIVPAVTSTLITEKAVKLSGNPKKLPSQMVFRDGVNREKSQKLSMSVP